MSFCFSHDFFPSHPCFTFMCLTIVRLKSQLVILLEMHTFLCVHPRNLVHLSLCTQRLICPLLVPQNRGPLPGLQFCFDSPLHLPPT